MTPNFISRIVTLSFFIFYLLLFSCNSRNSPNLPEKKLMELVNDLSQTKTDLIPDSNYIPSAGIKYPEIRAIDPSNLPEVIDIVGNINNKKIFKLSDIASSVRYILLQPPPNIKITSITDMATDEERIFINTPQGLFCYTSQGQYLYTVVKNQLEDSFMGTSRSRIVWGSTGKIDLWNGILVHRLTHWHTIAVGGWCYSKISSTIEFYNRCRIRKALFIDE